MTPTDFNPNTSDVQTALPQITIEHQINRGGQKIVYKAEYEPYGTVALKLIKPAMSSFDRIMREIDAISRVTGPHFAEIYTHGICNLEEDVIYVAEEFIEGQSLREKLDSEGRMSMSEALDVGVAILEALSIVASEDLVHRDIKPENIMLANDGRVVLLDFGIARHLDRTSITMDAAMCGPMTPGYAAPEQIKNEKRKICNRTDLFAWGIMIYECLAGYNPFISGCTSREEVLTKSLSYSPPELQSFGFNVALSDIVRRCLNKAVHRRPHSATIIIETIRNLEEA